MASAARRRAARASRRKSDAERNWAHAFSPQTIQDVLIATAVSSSIASIMMGLFGNLPFALGPGMGLSAYLAFGLVLSGAMTATQALTSTLLSGACEAPGNFETAIALTNKTRARLCSTSSQAFC